MPARPRGSPVTPAAVLKACLIRNAVELAVAARQRDRSGECKRYSECPGLEKVGIREAACEACSLRFDQRRPHRRVEVDCDVGDPEQRRVSTEAVREPRRVVARNPAVGLRVPEKDRSCGGSESPVRIEDSKEM